MPARMKRVEAGIRVVIAFNEALNRHDVPAMMALMSDDCLFENTSPAPDGAEIRGRAAVTQFWEAFFQAAPHARITVEEIFGLGQRCVMRWRYDWGAPGEQGHVRGVDIYLVQGDLIREKRSYVKG